MLILKTLRNKTSKYTVNKEEIAMAIGAANKPNHEINVSH